MKLPHGDIEQVADGFFVAAPGPGEGTMGVVITKRGKIAIDTSSYNGFARMVRDAIDADFPGPWRFVVTTHSHFDHIGGNEVFLAPIIANALTEKRMRAFTPEWIDENTRRWIEQGVLDGRLLDNPRLVMPDVIFENTVTIRLHDLSLRVTRLGGHSEDSSVVYIPERRVLYAADLVFNGKEAVTVDADLEQWRRSLRQLQELPLEIVVAGHGRPGGPELLAAQLHEINRLITNKAETDET